MTKLAPFARFVLPLLVAGCASPSSTVGTEPTVLWGDATEPQRMVPAELSPAEARRIALAHDAAHTCEDTARAMAKKDARRGWAVMEQCIRRNDFSSLEGLVDGPWAEQLAASPDAALLFAHVIAVRGGDVANDLKLLRRRKIPVYSLQAALAEPDAYKGRTVILRGTAQDGRSVDGGRAFRLLETKVMAQSAWVSAPGSSRIVTHTDDEMADQPGIDVKGRGTVQRNRREQGELVEVLHNVSVKTGQEIVARVEGDEPSLEPATDYILVVRFEGERESITADGDVESEATGVVLGYFEPESGLFARVSR